MIKETIVKRVHKLLGDFLWLNSVKIVLVSKTSSIKYEDLGFDLLS
jgi:hypothetical protein